MAGTDIDIRTKGMEYVKMALEQVGNFQYSNEVKDAWRVAGRYLIRKGRENLQANNRKVTGNLSKSLTYKVNKGNTGIHIGFGKGGHHAHLVDRGHEIVVGTKRVRTGKKSRASLFWTEVRETDVTPDGKKTGDAILLAYAEFLRKKASQCPDFSR